MPDLASAGTVRVFPGCGATIQACVTAAPAGATIVLRTNNLVAIPAAPESLEINKPLSFRAAPGYSPKLGRSGAPGYINVAISGSSGTVSFRGIAFQQVSTYVEFSGTATGHRFVFE
ncbi:MAG: hypothetical protein M3271_02315, partial [Actinomycetota bacterium]|nr:hypothetical protein [Actinomycetota bacterium]